MSQDNPPVNQSGEVNIVWDEASLVRPHPRWSSRLYEAGRVARFRLEDGTVVDLDEHRTDPGDTAPTDR